MQYKIKIGLTQEQLNNWIIREHTDIKHTSFNFWMTSEENGLSERTQTFLCP